MIATKHALINTVYGSQQLNQIEVHLVSINYKKKKSTLNKNWRLKSIHYSDNKSIIAHITIYLTYKNKTNTGKCHKNANNK